MATVKSSTAVAPGRLNPLIGGVVGAVFVVVGLLGFTVSGDHAFAGHTGANLILFQVNGLHNVVHLAVGIVLILAAIAGTRAARTANTGIGAVYLILGVLGLFLPTASALNLIALNGADNALHIVIGLVLVAFGLGADRR
jgi:hypothetical protein